LLELKTFELVEGTGRAKPMSMPHHTSTTFPEQTHTSNNGLLRHMSNLLPGVSETCSTRARNQNLCSGNVLEPCWKHVRPRYCSCALLWLTCSEHGLAKPCAAAPLGWKKIVLAKYRKSRNHTPATSEDATSNMPLPKHMFPKTFQTVAPTHTHCRIKSWHFACTAEGTPRLASEPHPHPCNSHG
jgi:hypothetical protein